MLNIAAVPYRKPYLKNSEIYTVMVALQPSLKLAALNTGILNLF